MVGRVWQWRFAAPPEALWPILADTARFNEAIGLPRYAVTETPQPDGSVRRSASVRKFGITTHWEEGVPEWVVPRSFSHERRFHSGPLRRVLTEIAINPFADPDAADSSAVQYRLLLEPRIPGIGWLLRLGPLAHFGRRLDRLFRDAAAVAMAGKEGRFSAPPPTISAAMRERIMTRTRAISGQGYEAASLLATHLIEAPDSDVERMRPRVLARRWQAEPRGVIATCLAAAREGLLILRWDLICPRCRGAKMTVTRLDELPKGAHCPSCNISFDRDFSRNVEVTFDPADDIRPVATGTFCLASPLAAEHIKVQRHLAPGSDATIAVDLTDGKYRARTVQPGGSAVFTVTGETLPEITLGDDDPVFGPGHSRELRVHNEVGRDRTLVVEDQRWRADALTAHEVTTLQAFRDLFGDAVLRPGDQVEVRRVALMFTDIKGSTDMYNRLGDAIAYGWVREHFAVLAGAVRAHDGAVVKTIGDAVMAAFSNPLDALAAAIAIRDDIAEFNRGLSMPGDDGEPAIVVKIGLHCGPCIAVTLNERLDYFGGTVNLAARLEHESEGGDIVLSEAIAAEPGIAEALVRLNPSREQATVKGFGEPVALLRVPAAERN